MHRLRKHLKKQASHKYVAQTVKNRLIALIGFLAVTLIVLIFKIGEVWWSGWLIAHRLQIVGAIVFIAIFLIFLSPIMIEASSNTRTLSGPGKNPKGPRLE